MKILLTGATASQVAIKKGTGTFAGLVHKALSDGGNDVVWLEPSVSLSKDYLAEFDLIIVGIAPPTSTAAHRIYGALSVIQFASELGTLRLMLDAPEPKRVWTGLKAIYNNPNDLSKEFHYKRHEYRKISDDKIMERLHSAVRTLFTEEWPRTVFPSFPWMAYPSVSTEIPRTNARNLVGLNLDSYLLESASETVPMPSSYWIADVVTTKWTKDIEKTVVNKVDPVRASKWEKDSHTYDRMKSAIGCLISTYKRGNPWWSVALPQALSCGIPVVTDWKLSSMLGQEWTVLAHTVEEMNEYDRLDLAIQQKSSYLLHIPDWTNSVELACNFLSRK